MNKGNLFYINLGEILMSLTIAHRGTPTGILKYNGITGELISVPFINGGPGLGIIRDFTFGPNGNLFLTDDSNRILEYNGNTGMYIHNFVENFSGSRFFGLTFGSDGNLYAADYAKNQITIFDGNNGKYLSGCSSNLNNPVSLAFEVPEPSTLTMLGLGILGLYLTKRKK